MKSRELNLCRCACLFSFASTTSVVCTECTLSSICSVSKSYSLTRHLFQIKLVIVFIVTQSVFFYADLQALGFELNRKPSLP